MLRRKQGEVVREESLQLHPPCITFNETLCFMGLAVLHLGSSTSLGCSFTSGGTHRLVKGMYK
jgi:hypothetical protein